MRYAKFVLLGLASFAIGACRDDDGIAGPVDRGPEALIRFVNAVPDTGAVDFRFLDKVENLPTFLGVPFRGSSGGYQRVSVGTRPVRVFPSSNDQAMASQRLIDETITLAANTRYTLVYAGRAIGNQDRLAIIEEPFDPPTPSAGNIAVKALHVAVGMGAVDVHIGNSGTDPVDSPVATIRNVGYLAQSNYVTLPARSGTGNLYSFAVAPAGAATADFTVTPNQPGVPAPAGATYGPQPGVQISGSVLTALIVSEATPGTRAATSTNTTRSVILLIDKPLNP